MKKLILILMFISISSCDLNSLINPSLNMDNFPFNIEPFDKKSELVELSKSDPICGSYKYFSGDSENGIVDIFKYNEVYYLHYKRDDNAQYIGIGIKNESNFTVMYYYPNASDVGIVYYKIDENNLMGGFWSSFNTPGELIKEGIIEKF